MRGKASGRIFGGFAALALCAVAVLVAVLAVAQEQPFTGQWLAEPSHDLAQPADQIHFTLRYRSENLTGGWWDSMNGFNLAPGELQGLAAADISGSGSHVQFKLVRDAGSFDCDGWFKAGAGSGHFTFVPNANFTAELKRRGMDEPTPREQIQLALSNAGLGLIDELRAEKYEPFTTSDLVKMGITA